VYHSKRRVLCHTQKNPKKTGILNHQVVKDIALLFCKDFQHERKGEVRIRFGRWEKIVSAKNKKCSFFAEKHTKNWDDKMWKRRCVHFMKLYAYEIIWFHLDLVCAGNDTHNIWNYNYPSYFVMMSRSTEALGPFNL
jgi:hypothetical protein